MTDGELLEQAAQSIGLKYIKPAEGYGGEFGLIAGIETLRSITDRCGATTWNPLTDDGDALRLAVKLKISVEQALIETKVSAYVLAGKKKLHFVSISGNVSTDEATRRAITRAAAEIGKTKCE
jgi:hypothetical protein